MLGSRLKKLRVSRKLTQKQLAEKVNVTHVSISGYESGNRSPDTDTLQKLAEILNVSTDYLLGRSDEPSLSQVPQSNNDRATAKDKRDIARRLEEIKRDVADGSGLAFDGEPLSEEAQDSFLEAMEYVINTTKKINKKYTPKKYRKED